MNGWTLAKYVLAFSGVGIVLLSDRYGMPWLGYLGIGLIVAAFVLRYVQRARQAKKAASSAEPG